MGRMRTLRRRLDPDAHAAAKRKASALSSIRTGKKREQSARVVKGTEKGKEM